MIRAEESAPSNRAWPSRRMIWTGAMLGYRAISESLLGRRRRGNTSEGGNLTREPNKPVGVGRLWSAFPYSINAKTSCTGGYSNRRHFTKSGTIPWLERKAEPKWKVRMARVIGGASRSLAYCQAYWPSRLHISFIYARWQIYMFSQFPSASSGSLVSPMCPQAASLVIAPRRWPDRVPPSCGAPCARRPPYQRH